MRHRHIAGAMLLALLSTAASCGRSGAPGAGEARLRVAIAASLINAYDELGPGFEQAHGVAVDLVVGSSGKLAAQIENGAPFDVYVAADASYVDRVIESGDAIADTRTIYAWGRLVLWTGDAAAPAGLAELGASAGRFALANPEHAPYGRAAREALLAAGLWSRLRADNRLVFAANVRQALQFAETGNVDGAFTALALVVGSEGNYVVIDESKHQPLAQAAVVCQRSRDEKRARAFLAFLASAEARAILASHGLLQQGGAAPPAPPEQAVDWQPLWLSFRVAALATLLSLLIGVVIAALLASYEFRGRELVDAVLTAPLVLPPTVLGYYLLVTLGRRSWLGETIEDVTGSPLVFTVGGAVVAATVGGLPLVIKSARAALEAVDPTLSQAARTLGAGPLRTFFVIRLPLAAPGVIAGAMLGFAKALGDFGATLMVAGDIPGETQTAALYIYDAIQANRGNQAAGMVAVLSAVAVLALYAVNKLTRRHGHER